jgi:two-component system response regulator (stage 0 sporulation protein A)
MSLISRCIEDAPAGDKAISCLLLRTGFLPHQSGFRYLVEAIKMVYKNPDILGRVTKKLYPDLARKFQTNPSRVERNIRHAIETAAGSPGYQKVFGPFLSDVRPTNAHFLALAAEILRHGLTSEEVTQC